MSINVDRGRRTGKETLINVNHEKLFRFKLVVINKYPLLQIFRHSLDEDDCLLGRRWEADKEREREREKERV